MKKVLAVAVRFVAVAFALVLGVPLIYAQGAVGIAITPKGTVVASTSKARVHRYRGFVFAFSGSVGGGLADRPFDPAKLARQAIDAGGSFDQIVERFGAQLYPALAEAVKVEYEFDRVAYWRDLEGHRPVFEVMIGGKDSGSQGSGPAAYICRYALGDDGTGKPTPRLYYEHFVVPGEFGIVGHHSVGDELFKTYLSEHQAPPADPVAFIRQIVQRETQEEPGLVGAKVRFFTLDAAGRRRNVSYREALAKVVLK